MKKYLLLLFLSLVLFACKTQDIPSPYPAMRYIDLANAEVKYHQLFSLDIDGNGTTDFSFSTLLVGDPIMQHDRLQFIAHSKIATNLLNDDNDQSPVLDKGDQIGLTQKGYNWYEISSIVLAEKITGMTEPVHWEGRWKNAVHQYLPIQIKKNGQYYHGWIELSFDTIMEKLILHNAAISTEPRKEVRAGV